MPQVQNHDDMIGAALYGAVVVAFIGGQILTAHLSSKERAQEHDRVTQLVGERNITPKGIDESFAWQIADSVMPQAIRADLSTGMYTRPILLYANPNPLGSMKVPVIMQRASSQQDGAYFQIAQGYGTATYHCKNVRVLELDSGPFSHRYHVASLYTHCADIDVIRSGPAHHSEDFFSHMPFDLRDDIARSVAGSRLVAEKPMVTSVRNISVSLIPDQSPLTPTQIRPYAHINGKAVECSLGFKAVRVGVEGDWAYYKSWNEREPHPVISIYQCRAKLG